jgi:hypothetical protein
MMIVFIRLIKNVSQFEMRFLYEKEFKKKKPGCQNNNRCLFYMLLNLILVEEC